MYEKLDEYIDQVEDPKNDILEILIAAQNFYGRITDEVIEHLSLRCSTDPWEIRDTIEFFPFLIGRKHSVQVCTGLSCSLRGGKEILKELSGTGDEVQETPCRGLCSWGPNIWIDEIHYDGITPEKLEHIKETILKSK